MCLSKKTTKPIEPLPVHRHCDHWFGSLFERDRRTGVRDGMVVANSGEKAAAEELKEPRSVGFYPAALTGAFALVNFGDNFHVNTPL